MAQHHIDMDLIKRIVRDCLESEQQTGVMATIREPDPENFFTQVIIHVGTFAGPIAMNIMTRFNQQIEGVHESTNFYMHARCNHVTAWDVELRYHPGGVQLYDIKY